MKIRALFILLPVVSVLFQIQLYGQYKHKLDSLWSVYNKQKEDSLKIKIINNEIAYLYESINPDSAILLYKKATQIADIVINATKTPEKTKNEYELYKANSLFYTGLVYQSLNDYTNTVRYLLKAEKSFKKSGNKFRTANCLLIQGNTYLDHGSYEKSLDIYLNALKIAEEIENKLLISGLLNNIGLVHSKQDDDEKAIEYYNKSLEIKQQIGDKNGMSINYMRIGSSYASMYYLANNEGNKAESDKFKKLSLENYEKSLKLAEELNDREHIAQLHNNIGNIYAEDGFYDTAIKYYKTALKINEEVGGTDVVVTCNSNIAELYTILADSAALNESQRLNYLHSAIDYALRSFELSKEIKALPKQLSACQALMHAYKKLGDYKKSLEYAELFISLGENLITEEKVKALADMSAKYEDEKKELELEKMQKQKELDNKTMEAQLSENRKQQVIIFSALGGFIVVLVFLIIILRMFRQKKKANIVLAKKNTEIQQQKEEISAQRDEIEAQRDLVVHQNEHMEMQKKEITDSITYARRIQSAVLPSGEYAKKILGDHFILYKPKDIVSGDFYWANKINEWLILTVADCTGHGVPGAFMSMLGVSFLNEIVRKKEITCAGDILDQLREYIIESMQQRGTRVEQKDGMDMCLCVYNQTTKTIQYAGANNPLYIIKSDSEFVMIKPDKQPVAVYEKMSPFTNHLIEVNKGDIIYLASDGFQDQFGGPNNKKFKINRFKDIILGVSAKPMHEQAELLENVIDEWMSYGKGTEQVDDITILGIKL